MKERPILFNGPMVLGVIDDRKLQTRRIVKPQPDAMPVCDANDGAWYVDGGTWLRNCPFGVPGDRLIVKEASWIWCDKTALGRTATGRFKCRYTPRGQHVVYRADGAKPTEPISDDPHCLWRFKPGRFMPRWASRLTLAVTDVRVERVASITGADAFAEGFGLSAGDVAIESFARTWNAIYGDGNFADVNPWVWVVEFRRVP